MIRWSLPNDSRQTLITNPTLKLCMSHACHWVRNAELKQETDTKQETYTNDLDSKSLESLTGLGAPCPLLATKASHQCYTCTKPRKSYTSL